MRPRGQNLDAMSSSCLRNCVFTLVLILGLYKLKYSEKSTQRSFKVREDRWCSDSKFDFADRDDKRRIDSRVTHLRKTCESKKEFNYYGPTTYTFVLDVKNKLYGCIPLKSASTAIRLWWWRLWHPDMSNSHFFENVEWNEPLKRHIVQNKALLRMLRQGDKSERILVVRHPAVRFWSAWNQKFLKEPEQKIGQYICKGVTGLTKECEANVKNESETHLVSFESFAREFAMNNCITSLGDCNAMKVWNEHWGVQAEMCQVCGTNFTMIMKAETLNADMKYLYTKRPDFNKTNFPCTAAAPNGTLKSEMTGFDLIKNVYSSVPREIRAKIFNFYRNDFDLFNYKWNIETNEVEIE